jgi:hypothetical protein
MPVEPRIVPGPCPFGTAGGTVCITSLHLAHPNALALGPAAEAFGYAPEKPLTWPAALFTTPHGHMKVAAATA